MPDYLDGTEGSEDAAMPQTPYSTLSLRAEGAAISVVEIASSLPSSQ